MYSTDPSFRIPEAHGLFLYDLGSIHNSVTSCYLRVVGTASRYAYTSFSSKLTTWPDRLFHTQDRRYMNPTPIIHILQRRHW